MAEMRKFGDFATFKYGKMPDKKKLTETGKYPVYSGYRYVGYYDEYNTEANQIIVVARGVGGTGDVKLTKERCYLTNLSISADIDENIALPEFVYYYYLPRNLRYLDSGSAQSQITISDLEKVMIPLPSLAEQRAICGYMKMLDRKIEINEEVNENLTAYISRSETSSSPDMRRGNRASLIVEMCIFSLILLCIDSIIGVMNDITDRESSFLSTKIFSLSKSRVTIASKTAPEALFFNDTIALST